MSNVAEKTKPKANGRVRSSDYADYVNKILSEALVKSVKATDEYKVGYEEGKADAVNAICEAIEAATGISIEELIVDMIDPSERFYGRLLELVPKESVVQHRIGLDYTTKTPTTLTIISSKYGDVVPAAMKAAAELSHSILKKTGRARFFWVTTDHKLDQDLIDHDFPCYKVIK